MKKLILILALIIGATSQMNILAQQRGNQRLSEGDRQKYLTELRNQKHEFLVRELELTRDQQNEFFAVYDQMDDEINRINEETRQLETKVSADPKATDTEMESAARAVFEQKSKEGAVEIEYFAKFKQILTPKQLISLKNAERKFTQQLVRQHSRLRKN